MERQHAKKMAPVHELESGLKRIMESAQRHGVLRESNVHRLLGAAHAELSRAIAEQENALEQQKDEYSDKKAKALELAEKIKSSHGPERHNLIERLGRLNTPHAVPYLRAIVENEKDLHKTSALKALTHVDHEDATKVIIKALSSNESAVQGAALDSLLIKLRPEAVRHVLKVTGSDSTGVNRRARQVLTDAYAHNPYLITDALQDPDPDIRRKATRFLTTILPRTE